MFSCFGKPGGLAGNLRPNDGGTAAIANASM
jgi:hypothetical protein